MTGRSAGCGKPHIQVSRRESPQRAVSFSVNQCSDLRSLLRWRSRYPDTTSKALLSQSFLPSALSQASMPWPSSRAVHPAVLCAGHTRSLCVPFHMQPLQTEPHLWKPSSHCFSSTGLVMLKKKTTLPPPPPQTVLILPVGGGTKHFS